MKECTPHDGPQEAVYELPDGYTNLLVQVPGSLSARALACLRGLADATVMSEEGLTDHPDGVSAKLVLGLNSPALPSHSSAAPAPATGNSQSSSRTTALPSSAHSQQRSEESTSPLGASVYMAPAPPSPLSPHALLRPQWSPPRLTLSSSAHNAREVSPTPCNPPSSQSWSLPSPVHAPPLGSFDLDLLGDAMPNASLVGSAKGCTATPPGSWKSSSGQTPMKKLDFVHIPHKSE